MSVKSSGTHEPRRRFARTGRQLFQHRLTGACELRQRVRPVRAAPFSAPTQRGARTAAGGFAPDGRHSFSAPADRGIRTASACSPLTGGEFFTEPQRGDSPSADGGNVPYPRRWAKRKDNLRFSFLFELLPFPWRVWRRLPTCDRCEIEERQSGYPQREFREIFAVHR